MIYPNGKNITIADLEDGSRVIEVLNPDNGAWQHMRITEESFLGVLTAAHAYYQNKGLSLLKLVAANAADPAIQLIRSPTPEEQHLHNLSNPPKDTQDAGTNQG